MIHHQAILLIEDLKGYELPSTGPKSPAADGSDFQRSLTGASSMPAGTSSSTSVSTMLETAMEELFVPYLEGSRYIERESKSLTELYASFLTTFTRYHVSLASYE